MHYRHDNTGTAVYAWCRSVYASYSTHFCLVGTDGTADSNAADYSRAVAPGFAT